MQTFVHTLSSFIVGICQILAMFVISVGISKGMVIYVKDALLGGNSKAAIQESRTELGHAFSLSLGFLIGGSILHSTVAPTWNEIGQLASIISIRTLLNYFLMKEMSKNDK